MTACACVEDVVCMACMTGAVDPVTGLPTPPADDEREAMAKVWLTLYHGSIDATALILAFKAGYAAAEARPHGTVTDAVEAERQRATAHAREGYRANENCDDIAKRILSGEPAEVEVPGHAWPPPAALRVCTCWRQIPDDRYPYGKRHEVTCPFYEEPPTPPADDVREALAHIRMVADYALADAILAAFEVRPRGTVTDAEVNAALMSYWGASDGRSDSEFEDMRAALEAARLS